MSRRKRNGMTPAQAAAARWEPVEEEPEESADPDLAEDTSTSPRYWLIAVALIIVVFVVGAFLTPGA